MPQYYAVAMNTVDRRLSVAPMMACTDRHGRYLLRQVSRRALLYSEMVTADAVLHGDRDWLLGFDPSEHPVGLQLGGSEPAALAEAARIGQSFGYDEVNLNVGCPSDRVRARRFGAALMETPELVAGCVAAMIRAVDVPVTVKCRIGVAHGGPHDDEERGTYSDLRGFVETVAAAGVTSFTVHARIAVLGGLSPAQNREVPPLRYEDVYRLKQDLPSLEVIINGGITTLDAAETHLAHVDGVMIGRAAYADPGMLAEADGRIFGAGGTEILTRHEITRAMLPYVRRMTAEGAPLHSITRHMLGLFTGRPGARAYRRFLSENVHRPGAGAEVIEQALALVPENALTQPAERRVAG
jgi:tRNA-dihydrouridine synthase A